MSALVRSLGGYELEPWKSVVGENLFVRESGAVAAQFHDPPSIEPFSSTLVGAERRIVLGKKSGIDSIRIKAEELGLDVPEERRPALLEAVKRLGTEKRGLVTDDEFRAALVGRGAHCHSFCFPPGPSALIPRFERSSEIVTHVTRVRADCVTFRPQARPHVPRFDT